MKVIFDQIGALELEGLILQTPWGRLSISRLRALFPAFIWVIIGVIFMLTLLL